MKFTTTLLCFALCACTGSFTGVDAEKNLIDLSQDERTTVCENTRDFLSNDFLSTDERCVLAGQVAGAFGALAGLYNATCEATRSSCLEETSTPSSNNDACTTFDVIPDGCEGTVGDLETCTLEAQTELKNRVEAQCTVPGSAEQNLPETSEACDALQACGLAITTLVQANLLEGS